MTEQFVQIPMGIPKKKEYDFLVYIGRFSPFHKGHMHTIAQAMDMADNVIVLVGSANRPQTIKNPWSYLERAEMINSTFDYSMDLHVRPLPDIWYNDPAWIRNVQATVRQVVNSNTTWSDYKVAPKIGIIGHEKDETSFYLHAFPDWEKVLIGCHDDIHATDIRELYFSQKSMSYLTGVLPNMTRAAMAQFRETDRYFYLLNEFNTVRQIKDSWAGSPYTPMFLTADAMVVHEDHLLMVVRGKSPGQGLLALPGGHVEAREWIGDAAFRELSEETLINVSESELRDRVVRTHRFDHPGRSLLGRVVTDTTLVDISDMERPEVSGADDAREALWIPIQEIDPTQCFDDHYDQILYLLGDKLK